VRVRKIVVDGGAALEKLKPPDEAQMASTLFRDVGYSPAPTDNLPQQRDRQSLSRFAASVRHVSTGLANLTMCCILAPNWWPEGRHPRESYNKWSKGLSAPIARPSDEEILQHIVAVGRGERPMTNPATNGLVDLAGLVLNSNNREDRIALRTMEILASALNHPPNVSEVPDSSMKPIAV
jgi:hypothetical protein